MTRPPMRRVVWGMAIGLLLLPLVAMQLTQAVLWTPYDFLVAGFLLLCLGASYEIASGGSLWRIGCGVILFAAVVLIYVDGAVGIY